MAQASSLPPVLTDAAYTDLFIHYLQVARKEDSGSQRGARRALAGIHVTQIAEADEVSRVAALGRVAL